MADCEIRVPPHRRRLNRCLLVCGWFMILAAVYVGSIGPLVWLESRGFGTDQIWITLQKTVYYPIYDRWWHGPKWMSSSLSRYTRLFEHSGSRAKNLGPGIDDSIHHFNLISRYFDEARKKGP